MRNAHGFRRTGFHAVLDRLEACSTYRRIAMLLSTSAVLLSSPPCRADLAIEGVQERVVKIYGAGGIRNLYSYSSGFLVSEAGHVATIWNHVLDRDTVTVVLDDGRRFEAAVVNAEPQLDLAILKIQADDIEFPFFDLEQTARAGPGTRILAFSNVFRVATGDEPVSVMHGVVASRAKLDARRGAFELPYEGSVYVIDSVTNNSGAGGGVITTLDGRLLGMLGRELRNARSNTWVNFAIPIDELRPVIEQILTGNFTARNRPDDSESGQRNYSPVDFGIVLVPDVVRRTPAYVVDVIAGSPAARADVRLDDLVLFANDELVQSSRQLKSVLGRLEPGDDLKLILRRGDQLITVDFPVERKRNARRR